MNIYNASSDQSLKTPQSSGLPPFVMDFLNRNKIRVIPRLNKSQSSQKSAKDGKLEKAIGSIFQCRSPRAIQKAYDCLRKIVFNSPPFLQTEFIQLLFPYFITLSTQLRKLKYLQEFNKFVDKYRCDFSKHQQEEINYVLCENFDPSIDPHFEVNISQFAVYDLTQKFRQYDSVLLPYVFENWISVHIVPFKSSNSIPQQIAENFLNTNDETQNENNENTFQLYNKVNLNPDLYQGDSSYISSNMSTEGEFYESESRITDAPDIAHFTLYNHHNNVTDIKLSRCAQLLAFSQESHVSIHSLNSKMVFPNRQNQETILFHKNKIMTISFSSNSTLLASASIDGEIRVAHTEACRELCHYDYHIKPIYDISFDPNNFFLTAASHDRTISMWAMNNVGIIRQFIGHKQPVVKTLFVSNQPNTDSNSLMILSASTDSKIRLWDVGTSKMIEQYDMKNDTPTSLAIHPENNFIACGGINGTVALFDIKSSQKVPTELETNETDYNRQITDIKFTNDGKWLIASSSSGRVNIWSLDGTVYDYCEAQASTIDSICITDRDLIVTAGRSTRGFNFKEKDLTQKQSQMSTQNSS